MIVLLIHDSGFSPAYRPRGTPSVTAITIARNASSSVAGIRSMITSIAGRPNTKLVPSSPVTAPLRNTQYCSTSGLSRPRAAAARARSTSSATGLTRMSTGLPMTKSPKKTSSEVTNSTSSVCSRRRRMKTVMRAR